MSAQEHIKRVWIKSGLTKKRLSQVIGFKSTAHVCLLIKGQKKLSPKSCRMVIEYAETIGIKLTFEMLLDG